MKRVIISAAVLGSAFIFTSCATNNGSSAMNTPPNSIYTPPNLAVFDDSGFNHWPMVFGMNPDNTPYTDK